MDADQRRAMTQVIAQVLLNVPEDEVDDILREADGHDDSRVTPAGWGRLSLPSRRIDLIKLLKERDDATLKVLFGFIADSSELGDLQPKESVPTEEKNPVASIFVVHGHDKARLHETVRMLERSTGLDAVILHEQADSGRTILEKFEQHASAASYAVVLLTADDVGKARAAEALNPRGRQNVIFELGFFFGKLGRHRVAVLLDEGVEKPSDIHGLVYISLDEAGAWKQALARELVAANIHVDYSRIP